MTDEISALLDIPPAQRAAAVERWLAAQSDPAVAARTLADALAAMTSVPYKVEGCNAETALLAFLQAEGMRFPLDEAAEAAGDREIAAQLWAHASTSAMIVGELADLPYAYAKRAVLTGSTAELPWGAFQDSMFDYSTGFFEDIEDWQRLAARGKLPRETVARALAAAECCASMWSDEDRELLALLKK